MVKNIARVLLMSCLVASATSMHASQVAEHDSLPDSRQEAQSIVGSWMGINETGERWLISFTSDGIALSSVQSEVSTTRPVLTPAHGVWAHVVDRQFAITEVAVFYDIQTGAYQAAGKLRGVLTLDNTGDALSGTAKVEVFAPDGNLVATVVHTLRFTRIKIELLD